MTMTDPAVPTEDGDPLDHLSEPARAVLRVLRAHTGQWLTEARIEEVDRWAGDRALSPSKGAPVGDALIVLRSRGLIECREDLLREWRSLVPPDREVILPTNDGSTVVVDRGVDGEVDVAVYALGIWPREVDDCLDLWEFATLPKAAVAALAAFLTGAGR